MSAVAVVTEPIAHRTCAIGGPSGRATGCGVEPRAARRAEACCAIVVIPVVVGRVAVLENVSAAAAQC